MTVGDRIKQTREQNGLSQEELAKKLGLKGKSSISKIEAAKDNISMKSIDKYAKALGVEVSYLMGWSDKNGNEIEIDQKKEQAEEAQAKKLIAYCDKMLNIKNEDVLVLVQEESGIPLDGINELFKAYVHLPLANRLMIAQMIMTEYMVCESHETLINKGYDDPNLEVLRDHIIAARDAVLKRDNHYRLKK